MRNLPSARVCGACDLCCSTLGVEELGKAEWNRCGHLRPGLGGCGIYDTKPETCSSYVCMWRLGVLGGQMDRPDRVGLIVDTAFDPKEAAPGGLFHDLPVVNLREARMGALDTNVGLRFLAKLTRSLVAVVHRYRAVGVVLVGPLDITRELNRRAAARDQEKARAQ